MLIADNIIEKALENFPRWMDIRKRYKKSIGGNLLYSISEEVENMQKEIDDYIDSFFIPYYEDKVNTINDFVYKSNIGNQDIKQISLLNPKLEIVTDISKFNKTEELAYYQDGFIFTSKNYKTISVSINGYVTNFEQEKMHVWNAFDEFAAFIGIRRFQDESNKELYNRILDRSKRTINSSDNGLKNSICSSLINIVPELSFEDITIELPTADNLVQYYDKFETILDKLIEVNRDVIRVKQWGINRWYNEFKQIDYIPSIWDIAIEESVNGIGDNDDLKAIMIDDVLSTDVKLSFYNKSIEYINKYIENNNIDNNLVLKLKKYNNVLNSEKVEYEIIASEAADINQIQQDNEIMAVMSKTIKGTETRKISNMILNTHDVTIKKNGELEKNKFYRVRFTPKNKYDSMIISKCQVEDSFGKIITNKSGEKLDFKRINDKFQMINNDLVNKLVKKSINETSQLTYYTNLENIVGGIGIKNISKEGTLSLDIDECGGKELILLYDCKKSNVLDQDIITNNFYKDQNTSTYKTEDISGEKTLEIKTNSNELYVELNNGKCNITTIIGGKIIFNGTPNIKNGKISYSTDKFDTPQDMHIIITNINDDPIEISKILYSNYIFKVNTKNGLIQYDDKKRILPPELVNNLEITMKTMTQYTPVISKIFIGTPLDSSDAYVTDIITCDESCKLDISSNCNVELYESSSPFADCIKTKDVNVTLDYDTDDTYIGSGDNSYIILDTSQYQKINNIYCEQGTLEVVGDNGNIKNIIKLNDGEEIKEITIDGYYNKVQSIKTLSELISAKRIDYVPRVYNTDGVWEEGDKLYSSKLLKCFIIEKSNGEQSKVKLDSSCFDSVTNEFDKIEIINMESNLESSFEKDNDLIISSEISGPFDNFFIYKKSTQIYVANNESILYESKKNNIQIINTFNNNYQNGELMSYLVKSKDKNSVLFNSGLDWSIGIKNLSIELTGERNYNITNTTIIENQKLSTIINLKDTYITENKEVIELAQYIIEENDDYKVNYDFDVNDDKFLKVEFITMKNDGFNKLKYSNVIDVIYIGENIYNGDNLNIIDEKDYSIDREKGIITWNNKETLNSYSKLCIAYIIKVPISIEYNINKLYKKIQYPIQAYKKIYEIDLKSMNPNTSINLCNPKNLDNDSILKIKEYYKNTDIVYCECLEPGFISSKNEDIITISKIDKKNTLAIKSGWYYMFDKEYYMFSTDQNKKTTKDEYMTMHDISKDRNGLILHKKTSNMIKNSKMVLGTLADTYKINNFSKNSIHGSSRINSITACDSLNGWITFGMEMSLVQGINGTALRFNTCNDKNTSYAVLSLDDYISKDNSISFYNVNELDAYIGIGKDFEGFKLKDSINIDNLFKINEWNENINYCSFSTEKDKSYYLVIRGNGVIDDIILEDKPNPNLELHIKNISKINLNIEESLSSGMIKRFFLNDSIGHKSNECEISPLGYIENSSDIDWNLTKIKSFKNKKDWELNCSLNNVDIKNINNVDCALMTGLRSGEVKTQAIYIGNTSAVDSLIYKINNIPLDNMSDFNIRVYQAQTPTGPFIPCNLMYDSRSLKNIVKNLAYSYIQLVVEMPPNKVINSIDLYCNYKSDKNNSPFIKIYNEGEYLSRIFDTLHTSNFLVNNIEVEDVIGDVSIDIRASKEGSNTETWTEWKDIYSKPVFKEYRFFQVRIRLKGKDSKIKIKFVDIEVKE